MKMSRLVILPMLLLLFLAACNDPHDDQAANQLVEKLHSHWQKKQWGAMLESYDKVFFAKQSKSSWQQALLSYDQSLGSLKKIKLIKYQVDARYSGDFYIYSFRLYFEHGDLREVLTIYKPLSAAHGSIVGHVLSMVKTEG